jgi:hypothetical protein
MRQNVNVLRMKVSNLPKSQAVSFLQDLKSPNVLLTRDGHAKVGDVVRGPPLAAPGGQVVTAMHV